MPVFIRNL